MTNRGAVCMGNPLVRFWEGQEYDWYMEEILWHRRESRRQTEKTNIFLSSGSLLSTHKPQEKRINGLKGEYYEVTRNKVECGNDYLTFNSVKNYEIFKIKY